MLSLSHTPGPPLSHFVNLLWLYEGYSQPHAKERILPSGEMELVINLAENRMRIYDRETPARFQAFPGALLSGAHSQYQIIDTAEQASVIGAHFRPGGAFPFLGMPAGELSETTVSLQDLWGAAARDVRERILEAPTPQARIAVLERVLSDQLVCGFDRHAAVRFALQQFGAQPHITTVAAVTDQIGLSARRFIQVFRDETGYTPKVFCRLRRFQQALDRMEGRKRVEWTEVALQSGYFDQAHFIHDFRAFSGINPSTYLASQTPHRNHVPLAE